MTYYSKMRNKAGKLKIVHNFDKNNVKYIKISKDNS